MTIELVRPANAMEIEGAAQAVIASGRRTMYVSGQTAQDETGAIVGIGDFRAQCHQVFDNLERVLAAGGATVADIAQSTTYIVDYDEQKLAQLLEVIYERYGETPPESAASLVGVARLYLPDLLLEIDAIAVLD